jgi:2-polyprenyl-3-methyl-5-hydroxy-6-metoxy-1,4-benzoquinol methylase
MRTRNVTRCVICDAPGQPLYSGLTDRYYGTPGRWSHLVCPWADCGLIWLSPTPIEEDIGSAYADYYTHARGAPPDDGLRKLLRLVTDAYLHRYLGYPTPTVFGWREWLFPLAYLHPGGSDEFASEVLYLSAPVSGDRLLDVGCGDGAQLGALLHKGWVAAGLEVDPRAVEAARRRGLPVGLGPLAPETTPDEGYEVVTLNNVLEHVPQPLAMLEECYRAMGRNGTLVVVTPNSSGWGHRVFKQHWRELDPPRHLFLFNAANLRLLLSRAGFVDNQIRSSVRAARTSLSLSHVARASREQLIRLGGVAEARRKLLGIGYQLAERVVRWRQPMTGTELVCLARKP